VTMTKAARTVFVYSLYLFTMGAGLLVLPNVLLPLFGFEKTTEVWVRLLGLFTFVVGIYYLLSALHEQKEFFKATVIGRLVFFSVIVVMVLGFGQPAMLLAIGSVDLVGALWTWSQLKPKS
jgi:hypothetical protein